MSDLSFSAMALAISSELQRMRLAYDLYGFVKLTNCLEPWQVDGLEAGFDRIYEKNVGVRPHQASERLPALNYGVEEDFEFMRIIASSTHAIDALKAVAGADCQYIAPDILCVYDDSIGAHRDTYYDFDVPKILIFLSDCKGNYHGVPDRFHSRDLAGSFAVLSGSHLPGSEYSCLTAQLSDWPDSSMSVRADLTPSFLRGNRKANGESFYPFLDYDSRYQGYSYIPFKRGDIVIFSTRALHALLPTHSDHFSKLIGLVFLEGFSKYAGRPLSGDVASMSQQEIEYLSTPYNLRMADLLTKGAVFDQLLATIDASPMGLAPQLAIGDPLFNRVFGPMTSIYRILESDPEAFRKRAYKDREAVMKVFHGNFNQQRQQLAGYYESMDGGAVTSGPASQSQVGDDAAMDLLRDEVLSKNYPAILHNTTDAPSSSSNSAAALLARARRIADRPYRLSKRLIKAVRATLRPSA